METIEKTLKYYELLMTYEDTSKFEKYDLPNGYHFEYYKPGDEYEWVDIHISSGEFTNKKRGLEYFHDFYDHFINELNKRCVFIVADDGKKVGTATISLLKNKEYEYEAAVDWVAIRKEYQGKHLSRPLISKFISIANSLGHEKLILHTQTHSWLAAKLYLDFGFEPYKVDESIEGWKILKTLTNHKKLLNINSISKEEIYSEIAIMIFNKLKEIHGNDFKYEIWYKNGRNDIYVNCNGKYHEYKYYIENNNIRLEKIDIIKHKIN